MKAILNLHILLLCLGVCGFFYTGCSTDPEVRMRKQMLRQLDSAFVAQESGIRAYQEGLASLQDMMQPLPLVGDTSGVGLSEREQRFFYEGRDRFSRVMPDTTGPVSTNPPVEVGRNTNLIHYSDSLWKAGGWEFFSTLLFHTHAIERVMERLGTGEWENLLSDVKATYTTESHREAWEETMEAIVSIPKQRYLLVIQDRLHRPPTVLSDKGFESGLTFSIVYLYDLQKKAMVTDFYLLAKNSFMVMTFNGGEKAEQIRELERDLRHEVYERLNKNLTDALTNGVPYEKVMPWKD